MGNLDKELKGYEEVYSRPIPLRYDLLRFNDEHRKFDALLRTHWDILHPLVRDLFTSFASEFQYIISELDKTDEIVEKAEENEKNIIEEYKRKQEILDANIEEFGNQKEVNDELIQKIEQLKDEINSNDILLTNQRAQIDEFIEKNSILNEKLKQQEKVLSESIEHVGDKLDQLETLEMDVLELEVTRQTSTKQIEKLKNEIAIMKTNQDLELAEHKNAFQSLQSENQQLTKTINRLKDEENSKSEQIQKINQDKEMLYKEIESLKNELKYKEVIIQGERTFNQNFKVLAHKIIDLQKKGKLTQDAQNLVNKISNNNEQINDNNPLQSSDNKTRRIARNQTIPSLLNQIEEKIETPNTSNVQIIQENQQKSKAPVISHVIKKSDISENIEKLFTKVEDDFDESDEINNSKDNTTKLMKNLEKQDRNRELSNKNRKMEPA
ncbi:MAG: hypothetical protein OEZ01_15115 [Candidatus Heimdallarchaeota archaeon]|nr:hypothetical protein [Candidatus Heimdallarchaeota archaeon]MDH5647338.1 hypothetical protein [Candidatus Heimdallarchaeota archaeon]